MAMEQLAGSAPSPSHAAAASVRACSAVLEAMAATAATRRVMVQGAAASAPWASGLLHACSSTPQAGEKALLTWGPQEDVRVAMAVHG